MQPIEELAALAHEHGIPVHSDAVQALGQLPLDFAASAVDCVTLSAHKVGGPVGAGALVARRGLDLVPVLHGGGQERGVRSGTLDAPAVAAFAVAAELAAKNRAETAERIAALRDDLVEAVLAAVPDASCAVTPMRPAGCPATRTSRSPAARATPCSTCSTPAASSARPVRPARPACRSRVTCCSPWASAPDAARGALRFSLGHPSTAADVDALAATIGPVVDRARRAGLSSGAPVVAGPPREGARRDERRRRLGGRRRPRRRRRSRRGRRPPRPGPQPGHPAHRRARLLHRRRRARRPPGRRRARHPLLRVGPRRAVRARRDRGLRRRVRGRPHPEPVRALQRADQVLGAARQGPRPRLRRRLHRPLRPARGRPGGPGAAPCRRRRQGPVVRARGAHARAARARAVPPRRHRQGRRPRRGGRARPAARRQARLARHLLRERRRHQGLAGGAARPAPGGDRRRRRRRSSASTTAPTPTRSGSGTGCAWAGRPPTAGRGSCWRSAPRPTRSWSAPASCSRSTSSTGPRRPGAAPRRAPATRSASRCGPTARSCRASSRPWPRTPSACGWPARSARRRRGRRSRSTPGQGSWVRRP